jgi:hypothetical protein
MVDSTIVYETITLNGIFGTLLKKYVKMSQTCKRAGQIAASDKAQYVNIPLAKDCQVKVYLS